jgi:ribonucleoside-diphosphate reductase alpha chain
MEFIDYVSKCESIELSKERGRFNNFVGSIYDGKDFLYNKYQGKSAGKISDSQWKELDEQIKKFGIRNATTTCIAPTGTISMIASASGGVEPLFGLVFSRLIMDGTEMLEINPIFKDYMVSRGLYSEELMQQIAKEGSVAHVAGVSDEIKHIFATAHDVSPYWHVKMQAAFQLHTDNAVSKTVNFEEHASREDIEKTYYLAYKSNLKGITVYRNNSRSFQPMNIEKKEVKAEETKVEEIKEEVKPEKVETQFAGEVKVKICPECGTKIEYSEGCFICLGCGYSGCS